MTPQPPLDLPRLVMRRALWVALLAWLAALVLGLQRAAVDIDQEVAAALALGAVNARLAQAQALDDIAQRLNLSSKTISNYQTLIRQRLGVSMAMDLLQYARRHRLLAD